jgi:hypothetical protein
MELGSLIENAKSFSKRYRVRNGEKFRLHDHKPGDTGGLSAEDKPRAKEILSDG